MTADDIWTEDVGAVEPDVDVVVVVVVVGNPTGNGGVAVVAVVAVVVAVVAVVADNDDADGAWQAKCNRGRLPQRARRPSFVFFLVFLGVSTPWNGRLLLLLLLLLFIGKLERAVMPSRKRKT